MKRNKCFNFNVILTIACLVTLISGCEGEPTLCPDSNHPHVINLGLPNGTKWSCCNVGATSPENPGGYYSWGETEVKSSYDSYNYKHGEASLQVPQRMGNIAGTKYDAAVVRMGSSWQMPTSEQLNELVNYCQLKWIKYKGHYGRLVSGPNGNSIFLPAGGERSGHTLFKNEEEGFYRASNLSPEKKLYYLGFHLVHYEVFGGDGFDEGWSIRPIAVE